MIAEQLRKSILQAAIQGKLTEQLPEDGDARDLLKEIHKEKQRLIREGKIKKDKSLPEITEEEISFEIPANWCWVRLGRISFNHGQKKPDKDFTYIDISSIDNIGHRLGSTDCILKPAEAPSRARKIVKEGDIIYSTVRPYLHNVCIIDRIIDPEPIVSTGFAVVCTPMLALNKYLFHFLLSPIFDSYVTDNDNTKGVAYPAINDAKFSNASVPLPPISEQQRIVERLEEALPVIDKLAGDETKLDELLESFPKKMKDAILQAAIQGKLTEQLPEDGEARDLLKEIQKEKQRLIREGKIKKDKPLPEITEDEIPFEIPANWCWVRLGEIAEVSSGTTPSSRYITTNGIPYYKVADMNDECNEKFMTASREYLSCEYSGYLIPPGSIIYPKNGGAVFTNKRRITTKPCVVDLNTGYCTTYTGDINEYVYYWFLKLNLIDIYSGTALPTVSAGKIQSLLVPLPPLPEQHRIVEKLNQLLPICDMDDKLSNR